MTIAFARAHGLPTATFRRNLGMGNSAHHHHPYTSTDDWNTAQKDFSRGMLLSRVMTQADHRGRLMSRCCEGLRSAYIAQSNEYLRRCEILESDYGLLRAVVSRFRKAPGTHIDFSGSRTTRRFTSDGQVQQLVVFGDLPSWIPIRGATRDLRDLQQASWQAVSAQYRSWLNLTDNLRRTVQNGRSVLSASQKKDLHTLIEADSKSRARVLRRWSHVWGETCGPEEEGWASYVYTDGTIDDVPTDSAGALPPDEPALRSHIDTYLKLR